MSPAASRNLKTRSKPALKSPLRASTMSLAAPLAAAVSGPSPSGRVRQSAELTPRQLRKLQIGQYAAWLRTQTNKHKRPFQEQTLVAYTETARPLDRWMAEEYIDGDFTACSTAVLNKFFADYRNSHGQGGTNTRHRNRRISAQSCTLSTCSLPGWARARLSGKVVKIRLPRRGQYSASADRNSPERFLGARATGLSSKGSGAAGTPKVAVIVERRRRTVIRRFEGGTEVWSASRAEIRHERGDGHGTDATRPGLRCIAGLVLAEVLAPDQEGITARSPDKLPLGFPAGLGRASGGSGP